MKPILQETVWYHNISMYLDVVANFLKIRYNIWHWNIIITISDIAKIENITHYEENFLYVSNIQIIVWSINANLIIYLILLVSKVP